MMDISKLEGAVKNFQAEQLINKSEGIAQIL